MIFFDKSKSTITYHFRLEVIGVTKFIGSDADQFKSPAGELIELGLTKLNLVFNYLVPVIFHILFRYPIIHAIDIDILDIPVIIHVLDHPVPIHIGIVVFQGDYLILCIDRFAVVHIPQL